MQKSMWLLAFLPYLHSFFSLVDGAVMLTSPSNLTPLVQPSRLNSGIMSNINVVVKERGPELPAVAALNIGNLVIGSPLAQGDIHGSIPTQAWSLDSLTLGVSIDEKLGGEVTREYAENGIYSVFLLMMQEKDFRSGIFEIQTRSGDPLCNITLSSSGSSALHSAPEFAHVTQLHPPPSLIADNKNSSSQLDAPGQMRFYIDVLEPYLLRPMDELEILINFMDMLITLARSPFEARVNQDTESIVPSYGVKLSLYLTQDDPPSTITYGNLLRCVRFLSRWTQDPEGAPFKGQALSMILVLGDVYQGNVTLVPSDSTLPTGTLIEASGNVSTGTATARKRWSMV